jgi:ribose transport system substrate-binding protein
MMEEGSMKKIYWVCFVFALVFLFVSCGRDSSGTVGTVDPSTSAKDDQVYIFVTALNNIEYMNDHKLGWEVAVKELGVTGEYIGPSDYNVDAQAQAFEQAIARNPKGIVAMPLDESLGALINKAYDLGIPTVTVDGDFDCKRIAFCGTGNVEAGRIGGRYVANLLNGKGKIGILYMPGTPSSNQEQRVGGYKEIFANYPDIEIVAYGDTKADYVVAVTAASTMIQTNPDLDAIICVDSTGGSGAATALKETNLVGKIKVVSMDKDTLTLEAVKEGLITATLAQNTVLMSYYALQILYGLNNNAEALGYTKTMGITPVPGYVDTGCYIIDSSNIDAFYQ